MASFKVSREPKVPKAPKATKLPKARSVNRFNLRNTKVIIAVALLVATLAFLGFLTWMNNVYQTEDYYVLNQNVPAKTLITKDMLQSVTTSKDTAPKAARDATQAVLSGDKVYSKYDLGAGDLLTPSNAVPADADNSNGYGDLIPASWVVTSFPVSSDNAVQGQITKGMHCDLMVVGKDGSYYPFVNLLVLDTTATLTSSADGKQTSASQQYVVGLSPQDAAKLQNIVKNNSGDIRLVYSPKYSKDNAPRLSDYSGTFSYNPSTDAVKLLNN